MKRFEDILGQETAKRHLQNAIATRRISHAYLLSGEAGMGKKTMARAFALALLCEKGTGTPCMECHACRQVLAGTHPDVISVAHDRPAIGVDDIREQVNDTVPIRPYSGAYKIYIADEAEKMTAQAQNALLKTIEEPPEYAVMFLLTANPEALLPTVRSRCVELKLKPLRDADVRAYLEKHFQTPEKEARMYAALARGNLGRAVRMAGPGPFRDFYDEMVRVLRSVRTMSLPDLLDRVRKWKDDGLDMNECLDFMLVWYRDALMFKVTKDPDLMILREEFPALDELSRTTGYDGFEKILGAIDKARVRLAANVNTELAMELMFLVMKENGE